MQGYLWFCFGNFIVDFREIYQVKYLFLVTNYLPKVKNLHCISVYFVDFDYVIGQQVIDLSNVRFSKPVSYKWGKILELIYMS